MFLRFISVKNFDIRLNSFPSRSHVAGRLRYTFNAQCACEGSHTIKKVSVTSQVVGKKRVDGGRALASEFRLDKVFPDAVCHRQHVAVDLMDEAG